MGDNMLNDPLKDVLSDILVELNHKNSQELDQIDTNCLTLRRFRCTPAVVQNVISICEILDVVDSAKYAAIELLDRLLINLVCDTKRVFLETTQQLSKSSTTGGQQSLDWPSVEDKLKKQMHLRAITCVVIANKVVGNKTVLSTRVQQLLRDSGYNFSLQNIFRSELRILKLLNYKLIPNAIDQYVGTLLEVLGHNIPAFKPYMTGFESMTGLFIDLYYICRHLVTRNAIKVKAKRLGVKVNDEELQMERMSANKMLISCAIMAAIPVLVDKRIHQLVVLELSDISGIEINDIQDMSQAILVLISDI